MFRRLDPQSRTLLRYLFLRVKYSVFAYTAFQLLACASELLLTFSSFQLVSVALGSSANTQPALPSFAAVHSPGLLAYSILFLLSSLSVSVSRVVILSLSTSMTARLSSLTASKAFSSYLGLDYKDYLRSNKRAAISTIGGDTALLVTYLLNPLFQILNAFPSSVVVVLGLLLIDWRLSSSFFVVVIISYAIIYRLNRSHISSWNTVLSSNEKTITSLSIQAVQGFREIIFTNQAIRLKRYYSNLQDQSRGAQAGLLFRSSLPRYGLELIVFALFGFYTLYCSLVYKVPAPHFATAGLLIVFSQRILPSFQLVYFNYSIIRSYSYLLTSFASVIRVYTDKSEAAFLPDLNSSINRCQHQISTETNQSIVLSSVQYIRDGIQQFARPLSFIVQSTSVIGIRGPSGSGKSTILDLVSGLLTPTSGSIILESLGSKFSSLGQKRSGLFAYCQQHPFVFEGSLLDNITCSFSDSQPAIPEYHSRLQTAIRLSMIEELINALPNGLDTLLSADNVRLSGGQRQRLAIARAIYLDKPFLILDEATSALDETSARSLLSNILVYYKPRPILLVSHQAFAYEYCTSVIDL